jgi:hypothetical protein
MFVIERCYVRAYEESPSPALAHEAGLAAVYAHGYAMALAHRVATAHAETLQKLADT